jgi:CYTH domain-containing protein
MGVEIERKYLLKSNDWKKLIVNSFKIKQGYLNSNIERTVRVRVIDNKGFLTIKSKNIGITRSEFEYEIPLKDAVNLLDLCEKPIIEKIRNLVIFENKTWEIDDFEGVNKGLIIAEIELISEKESLTIPTWIGKEVSDETKYYNSSLITNPFQNW